MFRQAWFYVTLVAVAAVAFLLYSEFTRPEQALGNEPVQVAREPGASAPAAPAAPGRPSTQPAEGGPQPQEATGTPGQGAAETRSGESEGGEALQADLAARGEQLYTQLGCSACHSLDGTPLVGPSWKGLYGHEVKLGNGQAVTADEAYLKESIENPDAKLVQGYPQGVMTATIAPYKAQLSQQENIDALIAFIKTLE
ncbi:c-type cytochrome [Limnochorda pilosa]|uniref:c-type cytochrome n=1 Tax=Limnochorda pilosa TaxID=1555112 RepID=UPI0008327506|nr:cytochrome c [Limnochorda pilosa]